MGLAFETLMMQTSDEAATSYGLLAETIEYPKDRSFAEGIGAINLAAEGQVPGNFAPFARALEKNYGLSREQVAFFDVHEIADRDHRPNQPIRRNAAPDHA